LSFNTDSSERKFIYNNDKSLLRFNGVVPLEFIAKSCILVLFINTILNKFEYTKEINAMCNKWARCRMKMYYVIHCKCNFTNISMSMLLCRIVVLVLVVLLVLLLVKVMDLIIVNNNYSFNMNMGFAIKNAIAII